MFSKFVLFLSLLFFIFFPINHILTTITDPIISTMPPIKNRGVYNDAEDALILELYKLYSKENNKWKLIAQKLNRNHKSVRERFVNHLDPTIDKSDLTLEEKKEIDKLQNNPVYTKKWAVIAKKISENKNHGKRRTELAVKNYWNSKDRTSKRKITKQSYERIRNVMSISYILG
ncbi:hypothetical protein C1645_750106 [Glomus cerebriforme]|uniref:Myb-like domain-containing protein n=1 Tax=Glomus cerebriforme TaxID=658196 RepID=A0A397TKB3_9GLOM|nr:hypothetical protein C1645_750106 [Glomus cerebriforme]